VRFGVSAPHIRQPHDRRHHESPTSCSALAEQRGDPLPGSAFSEGRVLLVEQPGPWGHSGLPESDFDRTVALELQARAAKADIRVLAVRLPGRTPSGHLRRWMMVDCRAGRSAVVGGTFESDAELLGLDLDSPAGEPIAGPLYFVCAHSKRDVCCALRGRAVAAALAELRPGQVYECAHLGGHRFAANVLVAPSGLLYGHVEVADAEAFVAAADFDVVLPEKLRGRLGLEPAAQTALAFGYGELGITRYDDLTVADVLHRDGNRADVSIQAPTGEFVVEVAWEKLEAFGISCAKPWPDTIVAYQALAIRPASDPASQRSGQPRPA
jgi:hypothetical protein